MILNSTKMADLHGHQIMFTLREGRLLLSWCQTGGGGGEGSLYGDVPLNRVGFLASLP